MRTRNHKQKKDFTLAFTVNMKAYILLTSFFSPLKHKTLLYYVNVTLLTL